MRGVNDARGFFGPSVRRQKKSEEVGERGTHDKFSVVGGHANAILVFARRASSCLIRRR